MIGDNWTIIGDVADSCCITSVRLCFTHILSRETIINIEIEYPRAIMNISCPARAHDGRMKGTSKWARYRQMSLLLTDMHACGLESISTNLIP